jgi:AraC-like DNA-binding protein
MVDVNMREVQSHGEPDLPIAVYDWYGNTDNNMLLECHWHEEWEFFAVSKGNAYFSVDGAKAKLSAGDAALIPGGSLHKSESADGSPYWYTAIVFNPIMIRQIADDIAETKYLQPLSEGRLNVSTFLFSSQAGDRLLSGIKRIYDCVECKKPLFEIRCKSYLLDLIADWIEKSLAEAAPETMARQPHNAPGIKMAMSFIHVNYASSITLKQLADMASMSEGHFCRVFKAFTSYTPMEYIIKVRLRRAAELLLATDFKLINIAFDTGFNNVSYFIRAFRACFHCSPTEYRKSAPSVQKLALGAGQA